MISMHLPNPREFDDLDSPEVEKFPRSLPDRPSEKKSYLSTLIRNNKLHIIVGLVCFLAIVGVKVAAAVFISQVMKCNNQGQAAMPSSLATTMTPTPQRSTVTKTMVVTKASAATGQIIIPISRLQSTVYAIGTAPAAPVVT